LVSSSVNYWAGVKVTVESAPAIMAAADLLLMEKVKAAVCEFLQKLICPENCVYLNRLAEAYVCPNLLTSSRPELKPWTVFSALRGTRKLRRFKQNCVI
jgi:hypothetical protein